ncbi:unnamed protein product [Cylicostephanus goldi]|uniref:Apple domain-containing protein n=1 Tax=Cylicostephanus goldi TaxID=71465 RepID=A0A3P7MW28_CYLGO|nr:unnamed protein product [Cylicostephanus goldi]
MLSTAKVVILLFSVGMTFNAGVFRYHRAARIGDPIYFLYLEDKLQCLRACYEESECAVVEHRENEEGLCRLSKQGDSETVEGFTFSREETDASCKLIEILDFDVSFQMIRPQNIAITKPKKCSSMPNVTVLQPYDRPKYRFFVLNSTKVPENWVASEFRMFNLDVLQMCYAKGAVSAGFEQGLLLTVIEGTKASVQAKSMIWGLI